MGQVTLNKNSWHFKYYSLIVSDNPPKSLCPYFWTMVLLIVLIPLIAFFMVFAFIHKHLTNFFEKIHPQKQRKEETYEEIMARWEKEKVRDLKRKQFWDKATDVFIFIFKYIFIPVATISLLYWGYLQTVKVGFINVIAALGIIIVVMGIVFGFIKLIETYGGKFGNFILKCVRPLNVFNWKVTKVCGQMIKAQYTKMCPLITWEGELKNHKHILD